MAVLHAGATSFKAFGAAPSGQRRKDGRMNDRLDMRARDGEVVPPPSPRRPPHSPRARPGPPPPSPLARPALAGCLGALAECPLLRCGVRTRRQPEHVARATRVHGAESFARAARQRAYARNILSPCCTA